MTSGDRVPVGPQAPIGPPRSVPVGPMLSMFDPMFIGIDEFGEPVYLDVVYHNLLVAGEPGGGKSVLLNNVTATGALAENTRLVLFDAKVVELGPWEDIADEFVDADIDKALSVLRRLLTVALNRYAWLRANRRRKISRNDGLSVILTIIDELFMFSKVLGTKQQQEQFDELLLAVVALGRACGMPVVAATQRPAFDIIPTTLRDVFGYRAAFRSTTVGSSNVILGQGWAEQGYNALDISPENPGEAFLLADGGIPRRIKVAYLSDKEIYQLADYAACIRRPTGITPTTAQPGHTRTEEAA
ncbi:FtsK/SpoIIIE domain-containing protein [Asanoa sp. NPDC049518]|uniref:FtsK/SpoIIIE domain-containing protein n=1 Tax=unclassified Asanoa TaxID=2685164 RepID=UPI0034379502